MSTQNPWQQLEPSSRSLRDYTPARVGLRRAGDSIATADILDFQLAHARARDAVQAEFDISAYANRLRQERFGNLQPEIMTLHSTAASGREYIRRPDRGRVLAPKSAALLRHGACVVMFVIADGLSAIAAERNAIPLLHGVIPTIESWAWTCGPICVVQRARVAIGDQIGELVGAQLSVVLIGERPGLSSPDSLGAYITWHPRLGRTDAERNCISNIRSGGLSVDEAGERLLWYLKEARVRKVTGIELKENARSEEKLPDLSS